MTLTTRQTDTLLDELGGFIPLSRTARQMHRTLAQLYASLGLLPSGVARPLWQTCPCQTDCWPDADPRRPGCHLDDPGTCGSIFAPWIGPEYEPGGVVALAINLRKDGNDGFYANEQRIAKQQIEHFARGKYPHRSNFAPRVASALAAVLRWADGADPGVPPGWDERISALHRTARVQSVKCSPIKTPGNNSKPYGAMWKRCPQLLLRQEMEILQPSVVVAFGAPPRHLLRPTLGVSDLRSSGECLRTGSAQIADKPVSVFALPHPQARSGGFNKGLYSLRQVLIALPSPA